MRLRIPKNLRGAGQNFFNPFFLLFPEFANSKLFLFLYFSESVMQTENFFTLISLQSSGQKSEHEKKWGAANLAKKSYGAPEGKHFFFK